MLGGIFSTKYHEILRCAHYCYVAPRCTALPLGFRLRDLLDLAPIATSVSGSAKGGSWRTTWFSSAAQHKLALPLRAPIYTRFSSSGHHPVHSSSTAERLQSSAPTARLARRRGTWSVNEHRPTRSSSLEPLLLRDTNDLSATRTVHSCQDFEHF